MAYTRRPSRSPRSRFTLGLLLLTAVTILVLDLPGTGPLDPVRGAFGAVFRPIRAAGNAVFEPIGNGWKGAFGYGDVKDENDELRARLDEIEGQEAEIERLEAQNKELRAAEGIETGDEEFQTAEVISGGLSSFEQTVEIDAGSNKGLKTGMAVVTGGGVLGRIAEVRTGSSTVELLTDSSVRVGARLIDGDLGLVKGQGRGKPLRLEGLPDDAEVEEDDFVYTSGIDRTAFPGDLVIGRVSDVGKSVDGIARVIEVEPTADLDARYVRVIKRTVPR